MIKGLSFSGGGTKGIAYSGSIEELTDRDLIKNIKYFSGTSVGSLLATLVSLGFSSQEIRDIVYEMDFSSLNSKKYLISKLWSVYFYLGINSTSPLEAQMNKILSKKVDPSISLKDLFIKTGKELVIVTTNITRQKAVYLHHAMFPNVRLIDAVVASMSVPGFFIPKKYNFEGELDYYCDGGMTDNYPIWVFNDMEKLYSGKLIASESDGEIPKNMYGLKLFTSDEKNNTSVYDGRKDITDFVSYASSLIDCMTMQIERLSISDSYIKQTIPVQIGNVYFLNLKLSKEQKDTLIQAGRDSIIHYFKN